MLKINPTKTLDRTYSEVPQVNPLHWETLFKEEDGSFTPTSNLFKCKDFLNDIVAAYHKVFFMTYGFDNNKPLNEEGVYFALSNTGKNLEHNLALVNDWCKETNRDGNEWCVSILGKAPNKKEVIFVPRWVFDSTYLISIVSWLIRISSHDIAHKSLMDMATYNKDVYGDCPFKLYFDKMRKVGINTPTKKKYWAFAMGQNSDKLTYNPGIHDNGVYNWLMCYAEGKKKEFYAL
jgi:hypothetical protein